MKYELLLRTKNKQNKLNQNETRFSLIIHFAVLDKLKWHYAKFSLQKMGCNSNIFQKIAVREYND